MKKTYISPKAEELRMMAENMLAASIKSIGGALSSEITISDVADDGSHEADVKSNIFGEDLFD